MRGTPESLAEVFPSLVALQPVVWTEDGLLCAPRTAVTPWSDLATLADRHGAPHRLSLTRWPDFPAVMLGGWYVRSELHAPAPPGIRELIQTAGDGFGTAGHVTTAMCLEALDRLEPAPAVDIGCGSGLLAQAWARRTHHPVRAIDTDPRAVTQTHRSAERAGCASLITVTRDDIASFDGAELVDHVVFANVPQAAHAILARQIAHTPPRALVISGIRPAQSHDCVTAYRRCGLRRVGATRRGRFDCHVFRAVS